MPNPHEYRRPMKNPYEVADAAQSEVDDLEEAEFHLSERRGWDIDRMMRFTTRASKKDVDAAYGDLLLRAEKVRRRLRDSKEAPHEAL